MNVGLALWWTRPNILDTDPLNFNLVRGCKKDLACGMLLRREKQWVAPSGELQRLKGQDEELTSQFGQGLDLKAWPQFPTTVCFSSDYIFLSTYSSKIWSLARLLPKKRKRNIHRRYTLKSKRDGKKWLVSKGPLSMFNSKYVSLGNAFFFMWALFFP